MRWFWSLRKAWRDANDFNTPVRPLTPRSVSNSHEAATYRTIDSLACVFKLSVIKRQVAVGSVDTNPSMFSRKSSSVRVWRIRGDRI